jgi:hypothetical protein
VLAPRMFRLLVAGKTIDSFGPSLKTDLLLILTGGSLGHRSGARDYHGGRWYEL